MGAFYLVFEPHKEVRARTVARLESAYQAQGFQAPQRLDLAHLSLGFYGKMAGARAQFAKDERGRFAGLCGTAIVDGRIGADAARRILARNDAASPDWSTLMGSFCVVSGDADSQRLYLDPLGVHKVYTDRKQRVFASSFLALANTQDSLTPNPQAVYEYVHQEATYGRDTVLNEVLQANCQGCYDFGDDVVFRPWPEKWRATIDDAPVDEHLQRCLQRLRVLFSAMRESFDDRIDTALSGGYDSRLTLALLREQGIQPAVHVYGREDSADVVVAQTVADGEGFALEHYDKARHPTPSVDEFPRIVQENYLAFDGWPPSGIFDSGVDLATRRARASGERLMLNGGGGEIFRNFFYLPACVHSAREVVHSFYNRYAPGWCTDEFDERQYTEILQNKLLEASGVERSMSRADVEYLYPVFRCGFWMGRNNAINNRLGWSMTPFIDRDLVRCAVRVPLSQKNHGRFEAAMIRAISPQLASYASDYGHDFSGPLPVSRVIKDWLTFLRPPAVRRFTYRVRFRHPQPVPILLGAPYLQTVVDASMPFMSRFYRVSSVNDPSAFARISTLEYLFKQLGVS